MDRFHHKSSGKDASVSSRLVPTVGKPCAATGAPRSLPLIHSITHTTSNSAATCRRLTMRDNVIRALLLCLLAALAAAGALVRAGVRLGSARQRRAACRRWAGGQRRLPPRPGSQRWAASAAALRSVSCLHVHPLALVCCSTRHHLYGQCPVHHAAPQRRRSAALALRLLPGGLDVAWPGVAVFRYFIGS